MFIKKETKTREVAMNCEHCHTAVTINRKAINLRETGYKGRFQAYVTCQKCGKDFVIPNKSISEEIMEYLTENWIKM